MIFARQGWSACSISGHRTGRVPAPPGRENARRDPASYELRPRRNSRGRRSVPYRASPPTAARSAARGSATAHTRLTASTYRGVIEELIVSWHPPHIVAACPELIVPEIIKNGTLRLAVDRLGRWDQMISGKDAMRARSANAREAGLLHIAEGDPVLAVVGDRRDGRGVIEYVECVYPEHKILEYVWTWQRQR